MTGVPQPAALLRLWLVAGAILMAIVIALSDSFAAMLRLWIEIDNFNHCLLIAPISGWLIWRQRDALSRIAPSVSYAGLAAVALAAVIWTLGATANLAVVQNFAAVGLIPLSVWAVLGSPVARTIMFPLGYLFFLVPFGDFLVPPLMDFTADMTVLAVRASGVAVYRDGLYLEIPNGSFRVIEACSGIRMLIAAVAVGALIAYLNFRSFARRAVFMIGVFALAIVANWVRAYSVVMVAHFSGMELIADHVWLGYVVFGIVIVILLALGARYSDLGAGQADVPAVDADARPPARTAAGGTLVAAVVIIGLVVLAPATATVLATRAAAVTHPTSVPLPTATGTWSGPDSWREDWSPRFRGDTATRSGSYRDRDGASAVEVYMIWYRTLSSESELINEDNRMFDRDRWLLLGEQTGAVALPAGGSLPYVETEILGTDDVKRLIRHWYVIDGRPARNRLAIKLRELRNALLGRPVPTGVVAVSIRFDGETATARRTLDEFIADTFR